MTVSLRPIYIYSAVTSIYPKCVEDVVKSLEYFEIAKERIHYLKDSNSLSEALDFPGEAVLIIPGGNTINLISEMEGIAQKVHDTVTKKGWGYMGFCAGANIAGNGLDIEWKGPRKEFFGFRSPILKLLPVKAVFPVYPHEAGQNNGRIVPVGIIGEKKTIPCYWNEGSKFVREMNYNPMLVDIYEVATYAEIQSQPLSAVAGLNYKGGIVLTGVHPEIEVEEKEEQRLFQKGVSVTDSYNTLETRNERINFLKTLFQYGRVLPWK